MLYWISLFFLILAYESVNQLVILSFNQPTDKSINGDMNLLLNGLVSLDQIFNKNEYPFHTLHIHNIP